VKILISSLLDLQKSSHNSRLHQFIKHLSVKHDISVVSINDWWKAKWDKKSAEYQKDFEGLFNDINYTYLTDREISPILQEITSVVEPSSIKNILKNDYDIHFSYNCLFCGYAISKRLNSRGVNTIYDLADDLPGMARTSPQIPGPLKPLGGFVSAAMLRKNIKLAKKVSCTTRYLSNTYQVPSDKSVLIPNGVDTDLFKNYNSNGLKSELNIDDDCFVVGHIGVLREWLDFEPLFEAFRLLSNRRKMKLLIVGGGIGFDETVGLANKYGISKSVIFTGTVPYSLVPHYISCMDAGVIPFKLDEVSQNSLPLKLFEYMACEKPVISTYVEGIRENFGDMVLYASDYADYAKRIGELHADEDFKNTLGAAGRKRVLNDFGWSKISLKLERLFEDLAVVS
jgi:glycosyltransferase involved in cell wall biosynthesis